MDLGVKRDLSRREMAEGGPACKGSFGSGGESWLNPPRDSPV